MKGLPTGDGGTVMLAGGSMKPSGQVGMQAAKLQQEMRSNEGHTGNISPQNEFWKQRSFGQNSV
jgi:hypothetical protein